MQFSKETVDVLKNFAKFNDGIVIEPGSLIRTMTPDKSVFAAAEVTENFTRKFAVYNLNQFISSLSCFDSAPEVTFHDSHMDMRAGKASQKYYYSDESSVAHPQKEFPVLEYRDSFVLGKQVIGQVLKASGVVGATHLVFENDGSKLVLMAADVDRHAGDVKKKSNSYEVELDGGDRSLKYKYFVDVNLFNLLPDDYVVSVYANGARRLLNFKSSRVQYYIAVESYSSFEE